MKSLSYDARSEKHKKNSSLVNYCVYYLINKKKSSGIHVLVKIIRNEDDVIRAVKRRINPGNDSYHSLAIVLSTNIKKEA